MPQGKHNSTPDFDIDLATFKQQPVEFGISLDTLSDAFARTLARGDDPYAPPAESTSSNTPGFIRASSAVPAVIAISQGRPAAGAPTLEPCRILEAILFVGNTANEPVLPEQVVALMRGVRHAEIEELVRQLNDEYLANACPYEIQSEGAGFRLVLRPEYQVIRDRYYNRDRQARLSKSAIEVLSVVAYNQPVVAAEIDKLRSRSSSALLRQLVRRQLLSVERSSGESRALEYRTTERFMQFFGLRKLEDLPQQADLERR